MCLMNLLKNRRLKGGVLFLLVACLTTCLGVIANPGEPDYTKCSHDFSEGCPVHDSWSWKCAQHLKNCSDPDHRYHCILNTRRQVSHVCAPVTKCLKGTEPVYDEQKLAISCEPCLVGYFQKSNVWSDEALKCEERHSCSLQSHKIECPVGLEIEKTQDILCRCDARNNFVPLNLENADVCFPWTFTCWEFPCPGNETERLMNYTCGPKCQERHERNDRDICVPIGENIERKMTTKGSPPPNTTVTATSTSYKPPGEYVSTTDYTVLHIAVSVCAALALIVIASVLTIAVCHRLRKKDSTDDSNPQDAEETIPLQSVCSSDQRNNANPSAVQPNSQTGNTVNNTYINNYITSTNTQIGGKNELKIGQVDDDDNDANDDLPESASNSHPAKSNSSSSGNQDIKTHVDKEQDHPNVNPADCPGNFRKICDETDAVYNMEFIVEMAKSVGIIRSPGVQGTGFRVGESYIITALHVVKGIINSVLPPVNHREGEQNLKFLEDPRVYIDFDFNLPDDTSQQGQALQRNTLRFNFEPTICYENEILDTAVLKLKRDTLDFPHQLTRFGHCLINMPMNFVGHSEGKVKQSDKSKPREDVTLSKIQECQAWSKQHQVGCRNNYRGYEGAENPSKILFDCTFSRGASGSPGFIISSHDHMPYVVTMLLCGYPDWLYDDSVSNKEKTGIQDGYTFEQGVRLTDVYKDMKFHKPELCLEIFGS